MNKNILTTLPIKVLKYSNTLPAFDMKKILTSIDLAFQKMSSNTEEYPNFPDKVSKLFLKNDQEYSKMSIQFIDEVKAILNSSPQTGEYNIIAGRHVTLAIKTQDDYWMQLLVDTVVFVVFRAPSHPIMESKPILTISHRQNLFQKNQELFGCLKKYFDLDEENYLAEQIFENQHGEKGKIQLTSVKGNVEEVKQISRELMLSIIACLIRQNDQMLKIIYAESIDKPQKKQKPAITDRMLSKFDITQQDQLSKIAQYAAYSLNKDSSWHVATGKNIATSNNSKLQITLKVTLASGRVIGITAFKVEGKEPNFWKLLSNQASNQSSRTNFFVSILQFCMFGFVTLMYLGGKLFCTQEIRQKIKSNNEGDDDGLLFQFCRYQGSTVVLLATMFLIMAFGKIAKNYFDKTKKKKVQ